MSSKEVTGRVMAMNGRSHHNDITTCGDGPEQWEHFNITLQQKYQIIQQNEQRWEEMNTEDANIIIVAFGSLARICMDTIKLQEKMVKSGNY